MTKVTLKDYENRHNKKYPDFQIKVLYEINNFIYFKTKFGLCKKISSTFGRNNYTIRSAVSKTEFLKKQLTSLYGDKYDYTNTVYNEKTKKINIQCKQHKKEFVQCFKAHLRGQGCPLCNRELRTKKNSENPTGWSLTDWIKTAETSLEFDSFKVYIIECWNEDEHFYKIGRTFRKTEKRFSGKRRLPYKFKIIKVFEDTAENIYTLETSLKKINKEYKYSPLIHFNGWKECYLKVKI